MIDSRATITLFHMPAESERYKVGRMYIYVLYVPLCTALSARSSFFKDAAGVNLFRLHDKEAVVLNK